MRSRLQCKEERVLQTHSSKAQVFRRKAKSCEAMVAYAPSTEDRDQLLRFRESYLALAAKEEWLDGLPPRPPVLAAALIG